MKKKLGHILLLIGFLAGSFVAVSEVDSIHWTQYGVCAASMLAGLILVRFGTKAKTGEKEQRVADIKVLDECLDNLVMKIRAFTEKSETIPVYEVHTLIDAELMSDLNRFVELREVIIPHFGLNRYADVMGAFATAERLINRSWSASADGYVDEVWRCLRLASEEMGRARTTLSAASPSDELN